MTSTEILRAAKEKISDPARWCQFYSALDDGKMIVPPNSLRACQWCALGSLRAVAPEDDDLYDAARTALGGAARAIVGAVILFPVSHINDTGTHADVMAMFDRAIALAETS